MSYFGIASPKSYALLGGVEAGSEARLLYPPLTNSPLTSFNPNDSGP